MTDREMLELAAKAYGINGLDFDYAEKEGFGYFGPRLPAMSGICAQIHRYWNPLEDDGDALRLAVTLSFIDDGDWPAVTNEIYTHCNGDWFAATRRAITIAAAKIGKDMK